MGLIANVGTSKKKLGGGLGDFLSNLVSPGGDKGNKEEQKSLLGAAITLPITDVLGGIKTAIDKLVGYSPLLAAEMKKLGVGMRFLLMPIGNVLSNFLRPWITRFNRVAFQFYADYQSGGLIKALGDMFINVLKGIFGIKPEEEVTPGAVLKGIPEALEIGATVIIGGALIKGGLGLIKALMGWLLPGVAGGAAATTGGGGLLIPAVIVLGSLMLGKAFGFTDFEGGLLAMIGLGAYAIAGVTGAVIAIPVTIAIIGIKDLISESVAEDELGDSAAGFINIMTRKISETLKGEDPITDYIVPVSELLKDKDKFTPKGLISAAQTTESWWSKTWTKLTGWLTGDEKSVLTEEDKIGENAIEEGKKVGKLASEVNDLPDVDRYITYHISYVED